MPLQYSTFTETGDLDFRKTKDKVMACGRNSDKLQFITPEVIRNNRQFLEENIEVSVVLDKLLECDVITKNEYRSVQKQQSRKDQRKYLINLLFEKNDENWALTFPQILYSTHQTDIIHQLHRSIVVEEHEEQGARVVIRLSGTRVAIENIDDDQLLAALGRRFELLDVYHGSIYILLETTSKKEVEMYLEDEARLEEFLRSFLPNSPEEPLNIDDKGVVIEVKETTPDELLGKTYGRQTGFDDKTIKPCDRCMLKTIRCNYMQILDEVETDIMKMVLPETTSFVHDVCINKKGNKPRKDRADIFLNHIMSNEKSLRDFMATFKRVSKINFVEEQCDVCSTLDAESFKKESKTEWDFKLRVSVKPNGKMVIQRLIEIPPVVGMK